MRFILLCILFMSCGIKYATNKVLSNPDAIQKVGAIYDLLTPRDTTERLVFIEGDSIEVMKTDTVYNIPFYGYMGSSNLLTQWIWDGTYKVGGGASLPDSSFIANKIVFFRDTVRINTTRTITRVDTIKKQLPPDNRLISKLNDSLSQYKAIVANLKGEATQYKAQVKTAEKRLIWMAAGVLILGGVIGLLLRFKI